MRKHNIEFAVYDLLDERSVIFDVTFT